MTITKKIDTILTIVGIVTSTFEIMRKTFKWYENKYGNKKKEKQIKITRPIIKGNETKEE